MPSHNWMQFTISHKMSSSDNISITVKGIYSNTGWAFVISILSTGQSDRFLRGFLKRPINNFLFLFSHCSFKFLQHILEH